MHAGAQPCALDRLARETTGEPTFDDLAIPLVVLTADLAGKRAVPISSGPVAEALIAGMTVPGFRTPRFVAVRSVWSTPSSLPQCRSKVSIPRSSMSPWRSTCSGDVLPEWPGSPGIPARSRSDRDVVVDRWKARVARRGRATDRVG